MGSIGVLRRSQMSAETGLRKRLYAAELVAIANCFTRLRQTIVSKEFIVVSLIMNASFKKGGDSARRLLPWKETSSDARARSFDSSKI